MPEPLRFAQLGFGFIHAVRSGKPPLPLEYPEDATKIIVVAERSAYDDKRRYLEEV